MQISGHLLNKAYPKQICNYFQWSTEGTVYNIVYILRPFNFRAVKNLSILVCFPRNICQNIFLPLHFHEFFPIYDESQML